MRFFQRRGRNGDDSDDGGPQAHRPTGPPERERGQLPLRGPQAARDAPQRQSFACSACGMRFPQPAALAEHCAGVGHAKVVQRAQAARPVMGAAAAAAVAAAGWSFTPDAPAEGGVAVMSGMLAPPPPADAAVSEAAKRGKIVFTSVGDTAPSKKRQKHAAAMAAATGARDRAAAQASAAHAPVQHRLAPSAPTVLAQAASLAAQPLLETAPLLRLPPSAETAEKGVLPPGYSSSSSSLEGSDEAQDEDGDDDAATAAEKNTSTKKRKPLFSFF